MRIWIVYLVLTHVMLFELHVLNSALCSLAHSLIIVKCRHLVIHVVKLVNLIFQYLQYLITYEQMYVCPILQLNHCMLKQELIHLNVGD